MILSETTHWPGKRGMGVAVIQANLPVAKAAEAAYEGEGWDPGSLAPTAALVPSTPEPSFPLPTLSLCPWVCGVQIPSIRTPVILVRACPNDLILITSAKTLSPKCLRDWGLGLQPRHSGGTQPNC